jgi:hypothetical protein
VQGSVAGTMTAHYAAIPAVQLPVGVAYAETF